MFISVMDSGLSFRAPSSQPQFAFLLYGVASCIFFFTVYILLDNKQFENRYNDVHFPLGLANEILANFTNCPQSHIVRSQGKDLYLPKVGGQDERGCSHC